MANVLADMVLRLGMDSAEIRRGLKTVESELQRFNKSVDGMKRALQGAFAATGAALLANELKDLVLSGAKAADQIGKLAQSAGVPVAEFSKLSYASRLADVDVGEFAQTLGIFSKKIAEAAGGEGGDAFEKIGVKVKDANGELRPTADILKDVAEKMAGYRDGAAKTALVLELFGRSGAKLMPLLNGGAEGMATLAAEAERLGLVIDGKTASAAETFNDSLTRLGVMAERLGAAVAAELAPSLERLAVTVGDGASKADAYQAAAEKIGFGLKAVVGMVLAADHAFERLGLRIAAEGAIWSALATDGLRGWRAVKKEFERDIADLDRTYAARMDALGFTEGGGYNPPKPGSEADPRARGYRANWDGKVQTSAPLLKSGEKIKKDGAKVASDIARAREQITDELGKLRTEIAGVGGSDVDKMWASITGGEWKKRLDDASLPPMGRLGYEKALVDLATDLEIAKSKEEAATKAVAAHRDMMADAAAVIESTKGAQQKYEEELDHLAALLEAGALSWDQFTAAAQKARVDFESAVVTIEKSADAVGDFARRAKENMQDLLADQIVEGFKGGFEEIALSWARMLNKMVAQAASAKILESVFGLVGGALGLSLGGDNWAGSGPWQDIPAMAGGGSVVAGRTYLIGEQGPELFTAPGSGQIIPNDVLGAGTNVTVSAVCPSCQRTEMAAIASQAVRTQAPGAVARDMRDPNGRTSPALIRTHQTGRRR